MNSAFEIIRQTLREIPGFLEGLDKRAQADRWAAYHSSVQPAAVPAASSFPGMSSAPGSSPAASAQAAPPAQSPAGFPAPPLAAPPQPAAPPMQSPNSLTRPLSPEPLPMNSIPAAAETPPPPRSGSIYRELMQKHDRMSPRHLS